MNVLDALSMLAENVDSDDSLVELSIGRLDDIIVEVFLEMDSIKALQNKLKQGLQILGRRRSDVYVRVVESNRGSNRESKCSGPASTSASGQRNGRGKRLLRDHIDKL